MKEFLENGNSNWKGEIKIIKPLPLNVSEFKKVIEVQIIPAEGWVKCYTNAGFCGLSAKNVLLKGTLGDKYIEFPNEENQLTRLLFSSQEDVKIFWDVLIKIQKPPEPE